MERPYFLLVLTIVSFSFLSFSFVSASSYNINLFEEKTCTTGNCTVYIPAFTNDATCTGKFYGYADVGFSSEGSFQYIYENPEGTTIAAAERIFTPGVSTCNSFYNVTASGTLELVADTTDEAANKTVYIDARYTCPDITTINLTSETDSRGYEPNIYHVSTTSITTGTASAYLLDVAGSYQDIALDVSPPNFQQCFNGAWQSVNPEPFKNQTATTGSLQIHRNDYWWVVFNTSNGNVNLTWDTVRTVQSPVTIDERELYYYALDDSAGTLTLVSTSNSGTVSLTLPENKLYAFIWGINGRTLATIDPYPVYDDPLVSLEIDTYSPDYQCTEFSDCVNGTQFRECTDAGGINPDIIQSQSCLISEPFAELTLGFEDAEDYEIYECGANTAILACYEYPYAYNISVPVDWSIVQPEYTDSGNTLPGHVIAQMVYGDSYAGSGSLALNQVPKMDGRLIQTGSFVSCGVSNTSISPAVIYEDVNVSVVSANFTFPSLYPGIQFAVKKPALPHQQWNNVYFGSNSLCNYSIVKYYGDEGLDMSGIYIIRVIDANTSNVVASWTQEATSSWQVVNLDFNQSDADLTHDHNIVIALYDPSSESAAANRVLFDDFRVQQLSQPLITQCVSQCNGTDYINAVESNGACLITTVINDSTCSAEYEAQLEAEADAERSDAIFSNYLEDLGINEVLDENNLGFATFFISPIFLVILAILGISGFLEYKINTGGAAFGISSLALTLTFMYLGIIDPFVGVLFTILAGFVVVWVVFKGLGIRGG